MQCAFFLGACVAKEPISRFPYNCGGDNVFRDVIFAFGDFAPSFAIGLALKDGNCWFLAVGGKREARAGVT